MYRKKAFFVFLLILATTSAAFANVRLPALMSDNMVLQQEAKVPIWGWAEPGEQVTVKGGWKWFSRSTKADKDGKWMVEIDTPKAGGPYEITVNGKNEAITIKNILIGEVWLCSGQSNMEMTISSRGGIVNHIEEIAAANFPQIRTFKVKLKVARQSQDDCVGSWIICSPKTAGDFSAVAYFFARKLHKELNVPIGLIHSSNGGTSAKVWTGKDVLESDPDFRVFLEEYEKYVAGYPQAREKYMQKLEAWKKAVEKAAAKGKKAPRKPGPPRSTMHRKLVPSGLYNGMIAPLMPFGIKGAIWYQGESDRNQAYLYRKLFPAMIKNWRNDWGQGNFPFYYVQIAPFDYTSWDKTKEPAVAELREAQFMAMSVTNTGMAVTMDIGNVNDIHPKNKQDVGKRLALWALAKTYGREQIVYSGPIYKSMKIEGDKIRLFFDYVDGGLVSKGGQLTHFTIAGKDKEFIKAKASIDGDTIVVTSDKIDDPQAVRYAFSNAAVPNLFNAAGLPASPFRTDDWPGVTAKK